MVSKGVMGKALTIIISLVLGIAALALLWIFLTNSTQVINVAAQKIVNGFKCGIICGKSGILDKTLIKGFCSGC